MPSLAMVSCPFGGAIAKACGPFDFAQGTLLTLPPILNARRSSQTPARGCGRFSVAETAWIEKGRRKGMFCHIESRSRCAAGVGNDIGLQCTASVSRDVPNACANSCRARQSLCH
jgi:hypothetical protein